MPFVPDEDLAAALATALAETAAPAAGAAVFAGAVRPADPPAIPHRAVFCVIPQTPGTVEQTFRRVGKIRQPIVQVRVRGNPNDLDGAADLAESAYLVLNNMAVVQVVGGEAYKAVLVQDAHPIQLGQDKQEHWEFAINVEMTYDDG